MEIVSSIRVFSQNNQEGFIYQKVYDSSIIPTIGSRIKDALFANYKTIIDVIYDYSEDKCFVKLEPKEMPDEKRDGHVQEVASMHNWIQK